MKKNTEAKNFKDEAISWGVKIAIVMVLLIVASFNLAGHTTGNESTDVASAEALRESKPKNSPSIRTHRAQAEKACGESVVATSDKVFSPDVVVMKMNGKVVIMGLDEALRRSQSKKHADNIWVLGACKSHVTKR